MSSDIADNEPAHRRLRLGIDTGGTYTDAVLLDAADTVLASAKALTRHEALEHGIAEAARSVLSRIEGPHVIDLVGLSTTLATNACVEGRGAPVGLLIIGFDQQLLSRGGLRHALGRDPVAFIEGGHDAHGVPLNALDLAALDHAILAMRDEVDAFAVAAQFSVRNPKHERQALARIEALTGLPATGSHVLSAKLDAPRRTLTTLLNARLIPEIDRLLQAVGQLVTELALTAPVMITRSDGSLMTAETARARPLETVLSGPAASVIGAARLSNVRDGIVADVGGTTTDVAVLESGRPRLNHLGAQVGTHRTMIEALDVDTFGVGGDSEVSADERGRLVIGPRRLVPLQLAAHEEPRIVEMLNGQIARPQPRPHDGRFALLNSLAHIREKVRSRDQQRLLAILADGPRPMEAVIERENLGLALRRLLDRGLVLLSGLTPCDAAHVLGVQATWPGAAGKIGAALFARRLLSGCSAEDLADDIMRALAARTAHLISRSAARAGNHPEAVPSDPYHPLVERAFDRSKDEDRDLLDLRLRLRRPIVAVGGPAALIYPQAAEALDAPLVLPPHYQVCNAVGAVVGEVSKQLSLTIARINDDIFRLHLPTEVRDASSLEAAILLGEPLLREAALREAVAAGAEEPAVTLERRDRRAHLSGGEEMVLETVLTATARGKPRLRESS